MKKLWNNKIFFNIFKKNKPKLDFCHLKRLNLKSIKKKAIGKKNFSIRNGFFSPKSDIVFSAQTLFYQWSQKIYHKKFLLVKSTFEVTNPVFSVFEKKKKNKVIKSILYFLQNKKNLKFEIFSPQTDSKSLPRLNSLKLF